MVASWQVINRRFEGSKRDLFFDSNKFLSVMLDELKNQGEEALSWFQATVSTWNDKPEFEVELRKGNAELSIIVSTNSRIYEMLNKGTSIRHDIMSKDWISKTVPNEIWPGYGRGIKVGRSRKPLPGIQARNFIDSITDAMNNDFRRNMKNAVKRGARAATRG